MLRQSSEDQVKGPRFFEELQRQTKTSYTKKIIIKIRMNIKYLASPKLANVQSTKPKPEKFTDACDRAIIRAKYFCKSGGNSYQSKS